MKSSAKDQVVMLDTSFLIRLMKDNDPLHKAAVDYYEYLLEKEYVLYVSTIALAEYCVKGKLEQIPFDNLRVVPFNLDHSSVAGEFAASLYAAREKGEFIPDQRLIIPNDTKIFAQAASINAMYLVTADTKSGKAMSKLSETNQLKVQHLDIHKSVSEAFSLLLFESEEA